MRVETAAAVAVVVKPMWLAEMAVLIRAVAAVAVLIIIELITAEMAALVL